ncbi:MAG: diphosphomevalonate decarboxylase [Chloroflexi bacterium]|nr:MAG: diphosphomevalonate decarboxylase [Chloroflexota bacterium]MBL1193431.1 diphosphomevalonate decarboxylase [Chloroflexota bacterium]NOH10723.1 diphosphomevalonate decarboxylase [Chloroflexota bacterium]
MTVEEIKDYATAFKKSMWSPVIDLLNLRGRLAIEKNQEVIDSQMPSKTATAVAHPNIAFIKYWGNINHELRIPTNGSISMNLASLETRTTVTFEESLDKDVLLLNNEPATDAAVTRVSQLLNRVREVAGIDVHASVESNNNFPTGAGIASSASAFAALALAASRAAGLNSDSDELSRLARTGSGSASRSVPGGFVEWYAGEDHETSYANSIAAPEHWDLVDCVAIVSDVHKRTGSTQGHQSADSSLLQSARVADAPRRLELCRQALLEKDFHNFAEVVELDNNLMHAVMMTSKPPLIYWQPATLAVMDAVQEWRSNGLEACYTIDAGPNVHVICTADDSQKVQEKLLKIEGVKKVLTAKPGGPAHLVG